VSTTFSKKKDLLQYPTTHPTVHQKYNPSFELSPLIDARWLSCCLAEENAAKFTARNLANALWALAKMMINPGEKFLTVLRDETLKKVAEFNAQNLANTLWAFATLGNPLPAKKRMGTTSKMVHKSYSMAVTSDH